MEGYGNHVMEIKILKYLKAIEITKSLKSHGNQINAIIKKSPKIHGN